MSTTEKIIGIMGAIPEEINGVIALLQHQEKTVIGQRTYYTGTINNQKVVVVYSRIGKVAAATTVSTLLLRFNIDELIFTGVAGAIHPDLRVGDIVVGTSLVQHDMNAFPLFPIHEIPLLGISAFLADEAAVKKAEAAIDHLLDQQHLHQLISKEELMAFGIERPKRYSGLIASGDQFFHQHQQKVNLQQQLGDVLCVEMEGAAVAQVCYEFGVPFTVIRTISDEANESSTIDFQRFIQKISSCYSIEVIQQLIPMKKAL